MVVVPMVSLPTSDAEFNQAVNDTVDRLVAIISEGSTREQVIEKAKAEFHDYVWMAGLWDTFVCDITNGTMSAGRKYYPSAVRGQFEDCVGADE